MAPINTVRDAWVVIDKHRKVKGPKPATAAAIAKLRRKQTVHPDLLASLAVHDGDIDLCSYHLHPAKDVPGRGEWSLGTQPWIRREGYVTFAQDGGGNELVLTKQGAVRGVDMRPRADFAVASSLRTWLVKIARRLESGELVANERGSVDEPIVEPSVKGENTLVRISTELGKTVTAALERDDAKAIAKLLDAGPLTPTSANWAGYSVFADAASKGALAVVKLFVKRGCPIDLGAAWGARTALFNACWGGSPKTDVARWLLAHGADPDAQTGFDGTALHSTAIYGNGLTAMLIAAGADPKKLDVKKRTPRDVAEEYVSDPKVRAATLKALAKG